MNNAFAQEMVDTFGAVAGWTLGDAVMPTTTSVIGPAQDGHYHAGVTLGQPGIGDGFTSIFVDEGVYCGIDTFSLSLAALINPDLWSMVVWLKCNSAGDWTDGKEKIIMGMLADARNHISLKKVGSTNALTAGRTAGGFSRNAKFLCTANTDWQCIAVTQDYAANQLRIYQDGVLKDINRKALTAWTGGAWTAAGFAGEPRSVRKGTFKEVWHGWLAHGYWFDRILAPTEVAAIRRYP